MRLASRRAFLFFCLFLVSSTLSFCQNGPPQSDPEALNLVQQSIIALSGGAAISDVTLSGTATWTVASKSETASATLLAKGTGESRFDMTLSAGPRSEIRNDGSSTALGELLASDGSVLQWGLNNCLVNAVWFFPQLSVLGATGDPTLIFLYIGQETRNGVTVQHIQSYRYSSTETATIQQLSTMDVYLDASSFLPVTFAFNVQSTDGSQTISLEVDFSNYQPLNGIQLPFRVQRYVAGNLGFDFTLTSAQLNLGLSDSLFTIQ